MAAPESPLRWTLLMRRQQLVETAAVIGVGRGWRLLLLLLLLLLLMSEQVTVGDFVLIGHLRRFTADEFSAAAARRIFIMGR